MIQWFPGHMAKSISMMKNEIKNIDVVLYVVDARAPYSCINPKFIEIIKETPIIFVINKCDLGDENIINDWVKYFSGLNNSVCITQNSIVSNSGKQIVSLILKICDKTIQKYKIKGVNIPLKAMVMGVPNCGKSTLINNLCGKAKAITGNIAGVTKAKQWVKIDNNIELLDTPGTLWPAFNNDLIANHLAYIGSVKEEIVDVTQLAYDFIAEMLHNYISVLENRYNINIEKDDEIINIFDKICISKGFLLRKAECDYERCCKAIINDFKTGRLGKITLEKVSEIKKLCKKRNDNVK